MKREDVRNHSDTIEAIRKKYLLTQKILWGSEEFEEWFIDAFSSYYKTDFEYLSIRYAYDLFVVAPKIPFFDSLQKVKDMGRQMKPYKNTRRRIEELFKEVPFSSISRNKDDVLKKIDDAISALEQVGNKVAIKRLFRVEVETVLREAHLKPYKIKRLLSEFKELGKLSD